MVGICDDASRAILQGELDGVRRELVFRVPRAESHTKQVVRLTLVRQLRCVEPQVQEHEWATLEAARPLALRGCDNAQGWTAWCAVVVNQALRKTISYISFDVQLTHVVVALKAPAPPADKPAPLTSCSGESKAFGNALHAFQAHQMCAPVAVTLIKLIAVSAAVSAVDALLQIIAVRYIAPLRQK